MSVAADGPSRMRRWLPRCVAALAFVNAVLGAAVLWMAISQDWNAYFHSVVATRFPTRDPLAYVYGALLALSQSISFALGTACELRRAKPSVAAPVFAALAAALGCIYIGALLALPSQYVSRDPDSFKFAGVTVLFALAQAVLGGMVVRRTAPAPIRHARAGSWHAGAVALAAHAAYGLAIWMIVDQGGRYKTFISAFALWFAFPCAAFSLSIAGLAAWWPSRGIMIFGIAYHGAAVLLLVLWTLAWGFMGLWSQSQDLLNAIVLVAACQAVVIVTQLALYIVLLTRPVGGTNAPAADPERAARVEQGVVHRR